MIQLNFKESQSLQRSAEDDFDVFSRFGIPDFGGGGGRAAGGGGDGGGGDREASETSLTDLAGEGGAVL